MNITFIGGGNMATALIGGISAGDIRVRVVDPSEAVRQRLAAEYGLECHTQASQALDQCDVVVLAVKPQVVPQVLADLAKHLPEQALVVSVAAGVTISAIRNMLGRDAHVIRTMPNTPALVGAGITGLFAGPGCGDEDIAIAERIMGAVGATVWVASEELMDVVTAISGSGPAYFYLLTEAMANAGAALGLEPETAAELAAATVHGAGLMVAGSDVEPAELRRRVTSPGGTTQAALEAFQAGGFEQLVLTAARAAVDRGRALAGEAAS